MLLLYYSIAPLDCIVHYVIDIVILGTNCSVGGLVLDMTVTDKKYHGIAVFQPVMNGRLSGSYMFDRLRFK